MPKKIIAFLDELDKEEVLDCAKEHKIRAEIIFWDTCDDFEKAVENNPEDMMVYSGRLSINGHHIELRRIIDNNPSILFRKYGFNGQEYIHKNDRKVKNFVTVQDPPAKINSGVPKIACRIASYGLIFCFLAVPTYDIIFR